MASTNSIRSVTSGSCARTDALLSVTTFWPRAAIALFSFYFEENITKIVVDTGRMSEVVFSVCGNNLQLNWTVKCCVFFNPKCDCPPSTCSHSRLDYSPDFQTVTLYTVFLFENTTRLRLDLVNVWTHFFESLAKRLASGFWIEYKIYFFMFCCDTLRRLAEKQHWQTSSLF